MCAYGGEVVQGKTTVTGLPHAACPIYTAKGVPVGGQQQAMQRGAQFLTALMHPAFVGVAKNANPRFVSLLIAGFGEGYSHTVDYFDATFTGEYVLGNMEKVVDALTSKELVMFNLARTFDEYIDKREKGLLKESQAPDETVTPEQISSVAEAVRATPSDLALPDLLRTYNMATTQMTKIEHQQPESKKQLHYILLDASGSMNGSVSPNKYAFVSKGDVAGALSLASIKKALEEKSKMYFRFFAGDVDILHSAETVEDFTHLSRVIALCNYNGGSTRIGVALETAFDDIQKGSKDISKAEVLLLSDGQDQVDADHLRKQMASTKLNTLEILSGSGRGGSARDSLKRLSKTYVEIDPNTVDFENVSKVVPD